MRFAALPWRGGYPVSTRKKKCAYLVTYQHSAEQQFEKRRLAGALMAGV
jgi:hypothetical protein